MLLFVLAALLTTDGTAAALVALLQQVQPALSTMLLVALTSVSAFIGDGLVFG